MIIIIFSGNSTWEFHFHEVIVIATVIYSYTWLLPVFLWIFLTWRNTSDRYTLVQLQAVYGYSMALFIPLTVSVIFITGFVVYIHVQKFQFRENTKMLTVVTDNIIDQNHFANIIRTSLSNSRNIFGSI